MICPHCHKNTNDLSYNQINDIVINAKLKYPLDSVLYSLIRMFLASLPNLNKQNIINFLSRIESFPAEDVYFGINYFLQQEYGKRGKSWEYCSAIIARRHNSRINKEKLPALPPTV